jgi:zinc D-Ala-D-Ala dipeptidase
VTAQQGRKALQIANCRLQIANLGAALLLFQFAICSLQFADYNPSPHPQSAIRCDFTRAPASNPQSAILVDVRAFDPTIVIDLRYATSRNIFGRPLYPAARALLRRPVAERLKRAQAGLWRQGLGLKLWDAYRPRSVQGRMWALRPGSRFIANPRRGSKHSRGAAVDVTLVDRLGRELPMPTDFDEFSRRAHPSYHGGSPVARHNRSVLRRAMEAAGFHQNPGEWWHYDDPQWRRYPLLDVPLGREGRRQKAADDEAQMQALRW